MGKSIGDSHTLFDDHATMLLYRLRPGRSPLYLTRLTVHQFGLMRICKRYGPGRYVVCVTHHGRVIQQHCQITGGRITATRQWMIRWG